MSLSGQCLQSGLWLLSKGRVNPTGILFVPSSRSCGNCKALVDSVIPMKRALILLTDLFAYKPRWSATSLGVSEAPTSFCLRVAGHTPPLRHWLPFWIASPAPQTSTWLLFLSHSPTRMQDLGAGALSGQRVQPGKNRSHYWVVLLFFFFLKKNIFL